MQDTVMLNLLGDMWHPDLDRDAIWQTEGAKLHLYGKTAAGAGRKLGHVNLVGGNDVLQRARDLKDKLLG